MNELYKKLKENRMSLIASLPENSYEFAKIAWESGADAIKVHCNVFHNASQNNFGDYKTFRSEFLRIIKDSPVPVGIVAGGNPKIAETIIKQLPADGFDFVSLYAHDTTASFYNGYSINNFLAVNSSYSCEEIKHLLDGGYADILELSLIDKENYGNRLTARDLSKYQTIANYSNVPCVVPSQKLIYPKDIKVLANTGIKAVMIGAVVVGKEKKNMGNILKAFRKEIDKL